MKHLENYGKFNWSNDKDLIRDIINIARDEEIRVTAVGKGDIHVTIHNDGQENYKRICIELVTRFQNIPHDTTVKLFRNRTGFFNSFKTREVIINNPQDIDNYDIIEVEVVIEHDRKKEVEKAFDDILNDTISKNFSKKDVKIYKKWDKKYKDDPNTNHQAK
jgi:hypothetical protein